MTVAELAEKLELQVAAGKDGLSNQAAGCYIGDLMSLAMARLQAENVWITIQTNLNVVAVAALAEAGCVILAEDLRPDANAAAKADAEGIPILTSPHTAYELAGALHALGL